MAELKSGLNIDRPALSVNPYWRFGFNIRSNQARMETIGLFGPMRDVNGVQLEFPGADIVRSVFVAPSSLEGQFLMGSASAVWAATYDIGSSIATGTTFKLTDITPAALPPAADVVSIPSSGRVDIPPVWWFAEAGDIIVGQRANVMEPTYVWDRVAANVMIAIPTCPQGAVGGAIVGQILLLLGCQSFTDPDPARQMTIRWSDRFNFADWIPTDINVSGELQLEGGSRIVGGGAVSQGVIAWTDKRMALLTETGDSNSVFARRYIDGGRGLMANQAWCEADGILFWYDETRTLNMWAGGQPSQIICTVRSATIERMSDSDLTRGYLVANPEFGEVILWYPDPDGLMWTGLVYSYLDQVWSIWRLDRPGWGQRVGVIRNVGVDSTGLVYAHDLDAGIQDSWIPSLAPKSALYDLRLTDITPFNWLLTSCMLTPADPLVEAHQFTQLMVDNLPAPSSTGANDVITAKVTGYGELRRDALVAYSETQTIAQNASRALFRVGGKAIEVSIGGIDCTTLWRLGEVDVVLTPSPNR